MTQPDIDKHTGVETTGHSWDGVKELNNPLPRWWLIVFWVTVLWSIGYWIFMPAWPFPGGFTKGLRNHSERANVEAAVAALQESRASTMRQLLQVKTIDEIERDPALLQYTMAAGGSIFGDNCATCHGAGGQGFAGYPNLNDDDWLWGGTFDQIRRTIRHGVRSEDAKGHQGVMQAFGRDKVLTSAQIGDVVQHVLSLSAQSHDAAAASRGAVIFQQNCVSCHGVDGRGDQKFGAPNLTDGIWLYGGDPERIRETITNGRQGVMPAWETRMTDEQIVALAAYVHSLGGGK
ncbi:MAG: cytochrome-c oxidase, cbb3-type subunit III [Parvularculaceae bacterium]|nr:cytochrome-c oxidase, cbb3-type subunit III [Parvularculaceae bacterium]